MTATLQELGIDRFSVAKRIALVREILESVADDERTGPAESLTLHAQLPPLRVDEGGVVRIGSGRVSLDLIVEQFEKGMTPNDMVRAYDSLALEDVHAVIAYYLRHGDDVRGYLKRRANEADLVRAAIESERPGVTRAELQARRGARRNADAPAGQ